jgi:glucokinase
MTDIRHILAADIGGTNCRFGLFAQAPDGLRLLHAIWRQTGAMRNLEDVLHAWDISHPVMPVAEADALVLAVAGPVLSPLRGCLTHAGLTLDLRGFRTRRGLGHARLINDFTAQAYACLTPVGENARKLLPACATDAAPGHETKGIVGAGTGFGTATLIKDSAGAWLALPAEGGNAAFPFVGRDEEDFHAFVRTELHYPYARGDDVLTGIGLTLLHRFLAGVALSPRDVAAAALAEDTPTRRWYARFYGRACRNWMLTTLCRGGLYIAGGIAAKNPAVPLCPEFVDELYNTPHYGDLVKSIPVFLNADENSGLWGAAWVGARLLETPLSELRVALDDQATGGNSAL